MVNFFKLLNLIYNKTVLSKTTYFSKKHGNKDYNNTLKTVVGFSLLC